MTSLILPEIASTSTGILKGLHKLGVPDWAVWSLLTLVVLFLVVRKMMRSFED